MPKIVDHAARREEISAIAASLIASGGLEAATFREIARQSGYSKGVIEHYFENKEELISGALAWANHCYERRVEKATAGLSGFDALRKRIEATLPMDAATRKEWKVRLVFWSMAAIDADLRRQQARRFGKAVEFFEQDIARAMEVGDIRKGDDAADIARRLVNMTTGISAAALHNTALYSRETLGAEIDYLADRLVRGF